ncbi:MAG: TraU family protein [bacterium]
MRKFKILIAALIFTLFTPIKSYALIGCGANFATSALPIFITSIKTLYNVFPITVGGVATDPFGNLPNETACGGSPVCVCMKGPVPVPGLNSSFWWPTSIIETVKAPFCFPSLGISIPGVGTFLGESNNSSHKTQGGSSEKLSQNTSDQVHYIKYPVFALLDLFTDIACTHPFGSGLDFAYLSEIDPTWRNDILSNILTPESVLFANPIAQLACMADSATAALGYPLDPLFWCMGSWGSTYPDAQQLNSFGNVQGSAGLAARTIFLMTRRLMLWQTVGCGTLCQPLPMPIWLKSQFNIFPVYPGVFPLRQPIGRTGLVWDHLINMPIPTRSDNIDWFVYQHVSCCLL